MTVLLVIVSIPTVLISVKTKYLSANNVIVCRSTHAMMTCGIEDTHQTHQT